MIHILIADPDSATRRALNSLLQRKLISTAIVDVESIESLIRQLVQKPPDLLVLDWRLHGSPAPETCKLILKAYPHLKVILLSVDASDAPAAKEAGAIFIHKGSSPDDLMFILEPIFKNARSESNIIK